MRAVLTTLPHLAISLATYVPNSAGVISIGAAPKLANCAFIIGSKSTALIYLLSSSMISAGVFAGAPTASQT